MEEENPGCLGLLLGAGWWCTRKSAKAGWWMTKKTTKFTYDHREEIGKGALAAVSAGAGLAKGGLEFAYNAGSLAFFNKEDLENLEKRIKLQSLKYGLAVVKKNHLIDMGIIGGVVLTDYALENGDCPAIVEDAYQAAYPQMASEMEFEDAAAGFSSDELGGFLAGVKGKLFEMKYAEYLNSGYLPEGYHAELASSATQPGWDIAIHGPDDSVVDVLQCKASDSVSYIAEAARRYPDIDIVTLDDVHSQLMMHSALEGADLVNSGISSDELASALDQVHDYDVSDVLDIKIPVASLALIAFSEYADNDKNIYQKSFSFGDRGSKSMIAMTAGGALAGLTGTWWIGLLGALGTRYVASKGRQMRESYFHMLDMINRNDEVIERVKALG